MNHVHQFTTRRLLTATASFGLGCALMLTAVNHRPFVLLPVWGMIVLSGTAFGAALGALLGTSRTAQVAWTLAGTVLVPLIVAILAAVAGVESSSHRS